MVERKERDDWEEKLEAYPEVKDLFAGINALDGLVAYPDGQGKSLFKAYIPKLHGQRHGGFLHVWEPKVESEVRGYVLWQHQGEFVDKCRAIFSGVVKNSTNVDGSEIAAGQPYDLILRCVTRYADAVTGTK